MTCPPVAVSSRSEGYLRAHPVTYLYEVTNALLIYSVFLNKVATLGTSTVAICRRRAHSNKVTSDAMVLIFDIRRWCCNLIIDFSNLGISQFQRIKGLPKRAALWHWWR